MYDTTELKILEQVCLKPGIHKRELSKQLKLGMPSINYALNKLNKLLIQKKQGNQLNYFLNYSNEDITPYLLFVEYFIFNKLPPKIRIAIREFLKELETTPIMALIFGSYANNTYTKNSDIDILLVFQSIDHSKTVENLAKRISMKTNTQLNPVYLDYISFKDSFHNETKTFFKNIKRDKIILIGIEWWRQLKDEEA